MLFDLPIEILYKIVLYDIETYRSAAPVIGGSVDLRYVMGYFALDTHIAKYQRCMDEIQSIEYALMNNSRTSMRNFKGCVHYTKFTNMMGGRYVTVLSVTRNGIVRTGKHYTSQRYNLIDDGNCKNIIETTIADWNNIIVKKINMW